MRLGSTVTLKIPERFVNALWSTASHNFYAEQSDRFEIPAGETQSVAKIAAYHWLYFVGDNPASLLLLAGYLESKGHSYACLWDMAMLEYAVACDIALGELARHGMASGNARRPKPKRSARRK